MFADMQKLEVLSKASIARRAHWINEIVKISGHFGQDTSRVVAELTSEIRRDGPSALVDHLRLCGSIPEQYGHDTTEEKLYSKYTDAVLAASFQQIGLTSAVIHERADAADVEAVGKDYSLVADAKVFRLSRTAKNQKDFKIDAMHGWKRGKLHAIVVCPIYQLPVRTSQIYQQAISRSVCIFSYSHLAVILQFRNEVGERLAQGILLASLRCAEDLNPTKDSVAYWTCLNHTMLNFHEAVGPLWRVEKVAMIEGLRVVKEEALAFLARQRETIMRMSRAEAIRYLIADRNIDGKERVIKAVEDNGILAMA
ncbi:MAG TPA: HindIII family type II restriction endonuclease [Candidatus Acidoferrales bacterium]|nr:HindIII family type II restriction endonuclease [Candidatus Acidoferrales bacterium]